MTLLLDEDSQGRALIRMLRDAGHNVLTVTEAGLAAHSDAEVLVLACKEKRSLLTRNAHDFYVLHNANSNHAGILAEHQDRDRTKNMTDAEIARSISNLERSNWDIAGQFVSLNPWNYQEEGSRV